MIIDTANPTGQAWHQEMLRADSLEHGQRELRETCTMLRLQVFRLQRQRNMLIRDNDDLRVRLEGARVLCLALATKAGIDICQT